MPIGDSKRRKRAAGLLYGITAVVSLVMGGVYVIKRSFMPYHAAALSRGWGEVEAATQVLISALMTVAGGGWFTVGVVILDADERPMGAVSLSAPRSRLNGERFRETVPELLSETANLIELNIHTDRVDI